MPQVNLGKVQGKSIKAVRKVGSVGLADTYQVVLDDEVESLAGEFVIMNGEPGPQGDKGDMGNRGEKGEQGDRGATGTSIVSTVLVGQDINGGNVYRQIFSDGVTAEFIAPKGSAGNTGLEGPQGSVGATGETGPQGATGETGPQGLQGPQGPKGERGDSGVNVPLGSGFFRVEIRADGNMWVVTPDGMNSPLKINDSRQLILTI